MEAPEVQARAIIAAALITSHAVETPTLRTAGGHWTTDPAAARLRELTDLIYRTITEPDPT
jgi:hypothetical protein